MSLKISHPGTTLLYNLLVKESPDGPILCPYCVCQVQFSNKKLNAVKETLVITSGVIDNLHLSDKKALGCPKCGLTLFKDLKQTTATNTAIFNNKKIADIQKLKIDFLIFLINTFVLYFKDEYYADYDRSSAYNTLLHTQNYRAHLLKSYQAELPLLFDHKLEVLKLDSNDTGTFLKSLDLFGNKEADQNQVEFNRYYDKMLKINHEFLKINALLRIVGKIPLYVNEQLNYQSYFKNKLKTYYNFRNYITERGVSFENIDAEFYNEYENFLFLDLDGTLATEDGISKETQQYLKTLEDQKILKVIFCSGRPVSALLFLQKDLTFKPTAIGRNGSEVVFYSYNKDLESALKLNYQNSRIKENLQKISDLRFLVQQKNNARILNDIIDHLRSVYELPVKTFVSESIVDVITPLSYDQLLSELNHILEYDEKLKDLCEKIGGLVITPVTTPHGNIFTFAHGVSTKGATVKKFIESCNIDRNNTFNIGNGYNDISLIGVVGRSYSVNKDGKSPYDEKVHYISQKTGSEGVKECVEEFIRLKTAGGSSLKGAL